MIIVLIVLFALSILSLFSCTLILFSPYYYYSVILFIVGILFYLIENFIFNKYTILYPRNKVLEFENFEYKKAIIHEDGVKSIVFVNNHGVWSCEYFNRIIRLDLRGYPFPKSYLRAFIIRNMRYHFISNKRPLKNLFKKKFYIGYKGDVFLKTIDNKIKIVKIVNKGVSINSLISTHINRAKYYTSYLTVRTAYRLEKSIERINEKIYIGKK